MFSEFDLKTAVFSSSSSLLTCSVGVIVKGCIAILRFFLGDLLPLVGDGYSLSVAGWILALAIGPNEG